jgi:c-di-GMP-binding flagellar brake protein YcgR
MNDTSNERLGLEKRKHVRIEVEIEAHFKVVGDEENTIYHAKTKNISHSGVCLKVYKYKNELMEKIGSNLPRLEISIDIPGDNGSIGAYTNTAWIDSRLDWVVQPKDESTPILMGMAFFDFEEADEDRLNSFIADLLMKKRDSMFD